MPACNKKQDSFPWLYPAPPALPAVLRVGLGGLPEAGPLTVSKPWASLAVTVAKPAARPVLIPAKAAHPPSSSEACWLVCLGQGSIEHKRWAGHQRSIESISHFHGDLTQCHQRQDRTEI